MNRLAWTLTVAAAFASSAAFAGNTPQSSTTPPDDFGPDTPSTPATTKDGKKPLAKPGDDKLKPEAPEPAKEGAAGDAAAAKPKPTGPAKKILVLPFQAIYRSVPQKKLDDATGLLQKELEQLEGVEIVRGAVASTGAPPKGPSLDAARAAAQTAEASEGGHEIDKALASWKTALSAYEQNAAAIEDANELIFANLYYARALMMAGQDKEARAAMDAAARMAPSFELPREAFPRLFQKWFTEVAAQIVKEQRGQLAVTSVLPGTSVTMDGRPMDVAPVQIEEVTPGRHLIVAKIEGVPPFGAVVQVTPGKKTEVQASFAGTMGGSAVGRVTDAIAQNAIPKPAAESAATAGKEAGAAFVVFGGMSKEDDRFRVHTFVSDVKNAKIASLDTVSFDLELLTAESDVLRIARSVQGMLEKFPDGKAAIVSVDPKIKVQSTVNRVNGAPELAAAGIQKGPAKKAGPRAVFKPLKGGTVKIKDEEDN